MKFTRLATFISVAGLGLLAGCQSSNPCGGGLMSRFGFNRSRSAPVYDSGVVGTPVSSMPYSEMPYGGTPYSGTYEGPTLGEPTFMGTPGTIMPNAMPGQGTLPPGALPPGSFPPGTTLPPPMAGSDGTPRPLPGTFVPKAATPIPADPSSRFRN